MKRKLSLTEKKVLVRIAHELSVPEPDNFPEFPELSKTEIKKSVNKLIGLDLIYLDSDLNQLRSTEKGDALIDEFKDIEKQFQKNLYKC